MLTRDKPDLPIGIKNTLRKNKWNLCDEVLAYFEHLGISVHIFDKSKATPHLRIGNTLDYWPATTRFFIHSSKLWGIGYESLKQMFTENQMELEFKQAVLRNQS